MTPSMVEVGSNVSHSPIRTMYQSEDFRLEWANNIRFHLAKNVVCLRHYRNMAQAAIADAMGTSQSRIARIERGDDNVTIDTIARLCTALKGRLVLAIEPAELNWPRWPDWNECVNVGWSGRRTFTLSIAEAAMGHDGDVDRVGAIWTTRRPESVELETFAVSEAAHVSAT